MKSAKTVTQACAYMWQKYSVLHSKQCWVVLTQFVGQTWTNSAIGYIFKLHF